MSLERQGSSMNMFHCWKKGYLPRMQMSQEEIDQVKKEIEEFKTKSTQHAASAPALSAHYHRLYTASKGSLKRFDRITRSLENKQYLEERKRLKKGGDASSSERSA